MIYDYLICAVKDKKTGLYGNVFMARNKVELERDMHRVTINANSPYKGFESEFEVCILATYSLTNGINTNVDGNDKVVVFKRLDEIKNINLNTKEVLDE